MLLKWRDSYATGVEIFDQEHQRMLQMINLIFSSMQHGRGEEVCRRVIEELLLYTRRHFVHEEEMMSRYGYPGTEAHIGEHRALARQVEAFAGREKAGEEDLALQIHAFLRQWFSEHILETDKRYGSFFAGKDLSEETAITG